MEKYQLNPEFYKRIKSDQLKINSMVVLNRELNKASQRMWIIFHLIASEQFKLNSGKEETLMIVQYMLRNVSL